MQHIHCDDLRFELGDMRLHQSESVFGVTGYLITITHPFGLPRRPDFISPMCLPMWGSAFSLLKNCMSETDTLRDFKDLCLDGLLL